MSTPIETLVEKLFQSTTARHVKAEFRQMELRGIKPPTLGDFQVWLAGFMQRRFRRLRKKGLTGSQLAIAEKLIEHRALNPPTWILNQPA